MSTRAEAAKTAATKKGPTAKRVRKNAQRKPKGASAKPPTSVAAAKAKATQRQKRDASLVITAESAASSPESRASRSRVERARVRSSPAV